MTARITTIQRTAQAAIYIQTVFRLYHPQHWFTHGAYDRHLWAADASDSPRLLSSHGNEAPSDPTVVLGDGNPLATTTRCTNCHSADGISNARGYWEHGSNPGAWLAASEKSYCGSCHDDTPGNSKQDGTGTNAANKAGDDSTYGFYQTGHGLASGNYAKLPFQVTTDTGNPAADQACDTCHDNTVAHFTGGASTRILSGFADDASNSNCQQCHEPGAVATAPIQDYKTYAGFGSTLHNTTKCSTCHDYHGSDAGGNVGMTTDASGTRCTTCHDGSPATAETTHQGLDCAVCHNPHSTEGNLNLVRADIKIDAANNSTVGFTATTGAGSYAPSGNGSGMCEVCHTTTTYYKNDGTGIHPDQGGGNGTPGSDCTTSGCHEHVDGFPIPGGSGSHSTHTTAAYGPSLACGDCHGAETPPLLSDSQNLAETTVCNNCHSADGVANAKTYWPNPGSSIGTAGSWLVALGDKSFCGSCHDQTPGNTLVGGGGTNAQDKLGNDSTYGNYVTGHGKSAGNYTKFAFQLTAESGNVAANQSCGACHDLTVSHFTAGVSARMLTGFDDDASNSNCQQCHEPGSVAGALIQDYQTYAGFSSTAHGSTKCSTCHEYHGMDVDGNEGMTFDVAPTRCTTCHDGVTATDASTHQSLDCAICHNPHSQEGGNLNLVRANIKIDATTRSVATFTASTGAGSFAPTGDGTGPCEICHTSTSYYQNDSSGTHPDQGRRSRFAWLGLYHQRLS